MAPLAVGFPAVDAVPTDRPGSTWLVPRSESSGGAAAAEKGASRGRPRKPRAGSYLALGLHSKICAALQRRGYNFPTPIQRRALPPILAGRDTVVMARTGSGKTAAYLAPLLHRLMTEKRALSRGNGMRVLVLAPTRELALQIWRFWGEYSRGCAVRAAVIVGGEPLEAQFKALAVCPDVVVATPGRLLQLLGEMGGKGGLTLKAVEMVVFDEADRLFEGGLTRETVEVVSAMGRGSESAERQSILVSATMPSALAEFTRTGLKPNMAVIRLDTTKKIPPTLATGFFLVRSEAKAAALLLLLRQLRLGETRQSTLVFAGTHHRVDFLAELLRLTLKDENGNPISVAAVHGSMDQEMRRSAVGAFRAKKVSILLVTDVAARGIDLPELDVVINYEFPDTPKLFIHRVGRVARGHRQGLALSLAGPDEIAHLIDVHLVLSRQLDLVPPQTDNEQERYAAADMSKWASAMKSSFITGQMPRIALDEDLEIVKNAVASDIGLASLAKTASNAHQMYMRSRKKASGQSFRRSKDDVKDKEIGTHPFLKHLESSTDAVATHEVSQLAHWRPRETIVEAPAQIVALKRKRASLVEDDEGQRVENRSNSPDNTDRDGNIPEDGRNEEGDETVETGDYPTNVAAHEAFSKEPVRGKRRKVLSDVLSQREVLGKKKTARIRNLESQRARFYVPLQQDESERMKEKAMSVASGGGMADELVGSLAIRDATMDILTDDRDEMNRRKHIFGNKVWDRKAKKFVDADSIDSKGRNFHVASREARLRAKKGKLGYGTPDGEHFRRWLSRNRKTVEDLADQAASAADGDSGTPAALRELTGLGNKDFRQGAFGRRQRVIAAARNKEAGVAAVKSSAKDEVKTAAQIKKERKQRAKRIAKSKKKKKRRSGRDALQLQRPKGRSKLIIRSKK